MRMTAMSTVLSEAGAIALALLAELGGSVSAPALNDKLKAGVKKAAKDLQDNKGKPSW